MSTTFDGPEGTDYQDTQTQEEFKAVWQGPESDSEDEVEIVHLEDPAVVKARHFEQFLAEQRAQVEKEAQAKAAMPPPGGPPAPKKRKAAAPESEKKKKLRINAKKLLITIARCQAGLDEVAKAFEDKWGLCQYKIVKELHKDGFPHIHAALKFDEEKQVRSNKIVIDKKEFVMNFQRVSKEKGGWKGWLIYMDKDPIETISTLKQLNLMAADTKEELLSLLKQEIGEFRAMMSWDRVFSCWEQFNRKKYEWKPTFPLDSFVVPAYLKGVQVVLSGIQTRRKVVILIGPTRLGKTQMIRTIYHQDGHGYCRGRHNFQEWLTTSGPMILDDLEDGQWGSQNKPPMKAWTDSQPFNMSGKYKKTTEMHPRQVFILTNDEPHWIRDAYWVTNAHVIRISGKCFKK